MELLAPAGSLDTLKAAVQSGADAVYIGGSEFSARASAVNFTLDEIIEASIYCHTRDASLHVAANTLIKESETERFLDYIGKLYPYIDALIIQDIGMASKIRKIYPELPLHASTQMTVSSVSYAKKLEEMGFSRIVLARELSKKQIENIAKSVSCELEVFVHGAICICYSGQCLMSSIIGGRSGNRGMCAQPCRLPYELDGEKSYILSPKDLCMVSHLDELAKIGVSSLKIEGRLKRKEYVSAVCGIYRKYLDTPSRVEKSDIDALLSAFNRSGFTDGYFTDRLGADMMTYENPSNIGENRFSDWVYERTLRDADIKKVPINFSASLTPGSPLTVSCWDEAGHFAESSGDMMPEVAKTKPLDRERLVSQLSKLGATPYRLEHIEVILDEGITIPVSEINKVRRDVVEKFTAEKCRLRQGERLEASPSENPFTKEACVLVCEVETEEQAEVCISHGITELYAKTPLANRLFEKHKGVKVIAKLPPITREDRKYEDAKTDAVLISNLGQLDDKKECYGDFRLNITNSASRDFYKGLKRLTLSPELNLRELEPISTGCEVIAYGRIPLMVMENCPLFAKGKCQSGGSIEQIRDRMGESFPIRCSEGCVAEILNSKPIYMADKPEIVNILKINALRLIFTVENGEECGTIIEEYKKMIKGENGAKLPDNTFTRCHFYRGTD